MRRGAYQIVVEYSQPAPDYPTSHPHPQRTGFQVKYAGPDTEDCLVTLPVHRLYRDYQDQTLDQGITFLAGQQERAGVFESALHQHASRYAADLSARVQSGAVCRKTRSIGAVGRRRDQSELGYMLANPANLRRICVLPHQPAPRSRSILANFDFNFLPLEDNYHPPLNPWRPFGSVAAATAGDVRLVGAALRLRPHAQASASPAQGPSVAHFSRKRGKIIRRCRRTAPAHRRRHCRVLGPRIALLTRTSSAPIYSVTATDLEDDRWLVARLACRSLAPRPA